MKSKVLLQERYLGQPLPHRLGELATNLAQIKSLSYHPLHQELAKRWLDESEWLIEWTMDEAPVVTQLALIALQKQIAGWQQNWLVIWEDADQHRHLVHQAKEWSEQILHLSGLVSESIVSA
jgi:hypothetical protein